MQGARMLKRAKLNFAGQEIVFFFPDTPNMNGIVSEIFADKTYPRLDFMQDRVDLVMDIGANIGAAAIYFSCCYPGARVYAYEPAGSTFALLEQNARALPRITAVHAGLSDHAGQAEFALGGGGGETASLHVHEASGSGRETVELRRALTEFEAVASGPGGVIVKIDTEGEEVPVLTDLEPVMDRVLALYLEYHSEADRVAIDRMMERHGFTLFALHAAHPHRGEATYVRQTILDERTTFARYIIRRN